MGNLKIKIKKCGMVRKIDGQKVNGFYGKVISHGTKSFEDIVKMSCKMMIDGIVDSIKQGFIVDLGVLGKLYPAVNGRWSTDPDELSLQDMKPKVNYKAGDDIAAAIKGAQLSWTTEAETDENSVTDPENEGGEGGGTQQGGGQQSGGGQDTGGGLEP